MSTSRKLTRQLIFKAAKSIVLKDIEPTTANIREYLNFTGSQTTLHKYLKEWKLKCFKTAAVNNFTEDKTIEELQEQNNKLKIDVEKSQEQQQILAAEMAKTEKLNAKLTDELRKKEQQLVSLTKEDHESRTKAQQLEELYQQLKEERVVMFAKIEKDKDQLIESLREELRQVHQTNLEEIRNVSYNGHDALMQEKVKSMNFQVQVEDLTKKIEELEQQLTKANTNLEPLKAEVTRQRKFIKEVVTFGQMQAYEKRKQAEIFERDD